MNQSRNKTQGSALFTLISGVVIAVATLALLVKLATSGYYSDVAQTTESATETRIMPSGRLVLGDGVEAGQRTGQQVFDKICSQCHAADSTVAFSPKVTHNDQWTARIAQGFETLVQHAVQGFKGPAGGEMPAKGRATDLTDEEVARAVAYMANQSGANFPESIGSNSVASAASGTETPSVGSVPVADNSAKGKEVFEKTCFACHGANSPVPAVPHVANKEEWAPRIKQGEAVLFKHAIDGYAGKGMMPAKGGNTALSDDDVKAAVRYMVKESS